MAILDSPNAAYATSSFSLTASLANVMDWLPNAITLLSAAAGLVLCIIAIRSQLLSQKKAKLEIEELERHKST